MSSIACIIPCYKPHVTKLIRLLESIKQQTRLPDEVIVSCSSMGSESTLSLPPYPFLIKVFVHAERRNAAQNRNFAAEQSNCDILSFLDADDIMHPQRLELIEQTMNDTNASLVVHSYIQKTELDAKWAFYESADCETGVLQTVDDKCIRHVADKPVHQSQCSIRSNVFEVVKFDSSREQERYEDARFCNAVLRHGFKGVYIPHPLAKYDEAGFWHHV